MLQQAYMSAPSAIAHMQEKTLQYNQPSY